MVKNPAIHWFFGLAMLYLVTRLFRAKFTETPTFFKFYFTDLLFVPTMCLFALIVIRYAKRNVKLTLSPILVFSQVALVSVYFEWYLPNFKNHIHPYTSDIWDIVIYILGSFSFLFIQKKYLN